MTVLFERTLVEGENMPMCLIKDRLDRVSRHNNTPTGHLISSSKRIQKHVCKWDKLLPGLNDGTLSHLISYSVTAIKIPQQNDKNLVL